MTGYVLDPLKMTWPGGGNVVLALDVARAHVLLAERGTPGERYLVGAAAAHGGLSGRILCPVFREPPCALISGNRCEKQ